jgi:hypothetical protein
MFKSLPLTVREIKATEAVLNRIYEAARLGLKGDSLALKADLLPVELRRLQEFDPMAQLAEAKGRADAEAQLSEVMMNAALAGDAKVALDVLKHKHDWAATQHIQMDVSQQISILTALKQAEERVIEGIATDVTEAQQIPYAEAHLQPRRRAVADVASVVATDQGRP